MRITYSNGGLDKECPVNDTTINEHQRYKVTRINMLFWNKNNITVILHNLL